MAWEGLTEEERTVLTDYLRAFSQILDEVADYCQENNVQIVSAGAMLDLGAAYSKLAEATGLGNPFQRFLEGEP